MSPRSPSREAWGVGGESYAAIERSVEGKRFIGFGIALLSTVMLPVTAQVGSSAWLWQIWPAVGWGERAGLASPALLGLLLIAIGSWKSLPRFWTGLIGLWVLLACGCLFVNSDLQSHQMFDGFTGFVGRNPLLVLLGMSLVAAGAEWTASPELRPIGRVFLGLGALALVVFSLWPGPGGPLVSQIAGHAWALGALERWRLLGGNVVFWMLALVPVFLGGVALYAASRPRQAPWSLPHAARFLVPGLVLMMTYPAAMVGLGADAALLQIRASLLILVVVNIGARSLEMVVRDLMEDSLPLDSPPSDWVRDTVLRQALVWWKQQPDDGTGEVEASPAVTQQWRGIRWLVRRRLWELGREFGVTRPQCPSAEQTEMFLEKLGPEPAVVPASTRFARWLNQRVWRLGVAGGVALVALVVLAAAPWAGSKEPLEWGLGERTAAGDKLFGTLLPKYVASLAMRDQALAENSGSAEASVELRQQAQEVRALAEEIDGELAATLGGLVDGTAVAATNALGWIRTVDRINVRIRELGLPYYLYANAMEYQQDRKSRRLLYVNTYAVEELRWFLDGDKPLASMLARRLDLLRFEGDGLGRVVRDEPVATLLLDSIERTSKDSVNSLLNVSCEPIGYSTTAGPLELALWMMVGDACGELLVTVLGSALWDGTLEAQARDVILAVTERHELQHQADPDSIGIPVDVLVAHPSRSDAFLRLVSRELSAYTCELVTDSAIEQAMSLQDLFKTAMTEPYAGTPEYIVAALILGQLVDVQVLDERGTASQRVLESVANKLMQSDPSAMVKLIRSRAEEAHLKWFGEPCAAPRLVRMAVSPTAGLPPSEEFLYFNF